MEGIVFIESPDCFEEQAWILPSFKGKGKTPPAWRKKKTTKIALAGPSASAPVVLRWSLALSLQLSQIPEVKWCSVTGFSMLGLNAATTPTLSCFVSSLTPVIKDMQVLPFSAQEQWKHRSTPRVKKTAHLWPSFTPLSTEAVASNSRIQEKTWACGTNETRHTGPLLTGWLTALAYWIQQHARDRLSVQRDNELEVEQMLTLSAATTWSTNLGEEFGSGIIHKTIVITPQAWPKVPLIQAQTFPGIWLLSLCCPYQKRNEVYGKARRGNSAPKRQSGHGRKTQTHSSGDAWQGKITMNGALQGWWAQWAVSEASSEKELKERVRRDC